VVTQDFAEQKRQSEARQKAKELAKIEAKKQQERDIIKKQEFEQERDAILKELKHDEILRNAVIERIKYSLFYLSYDADKTFEDNLENPSFLAAVLNFVKMIKVEN
jgi:nitrous oxidase accessory protein NosD